MADYAERDFPLALIDPPEFNARERIDAEALGRLADDIAANGLHQRVGLRRREGTARAELIYGQRRVLAFQLLRRASIPARLYPAGADALQIRMAENELHEALTPIEEGRLALAFLDRGDPLPAVARHFRRSEPWVRERLALLDLPEDVRGALDRRDLPVAVARQLAAIDHEPYRRALIAEAIRSGASARVVDVWVANYHADRARIIANESVIDEIAARVETMVPYTPCSGCGQDVDFTKTRALRFCLPCLRELEDAQRAAGADAPPPGA